MKKYSRQGQKRKKIYQAPKPALPIRRAWGLATRLEHRRIKGKR